MKKKTIVLGASDNPARYSYLATQRLVAHSHPVILIGKKEGTIGDNQILKEPPSQIKDADTVTLYLNPQNQKLYYEYILSLQPKRIIFNPGTENNELVQLAEDKGINCIEGCTLVMLSTGQY